MHQILFYFRNKNGKFRSQKSQNPKTNKNVKSKNGVKKRVSSGRVQDARQKIIQKKRKVIDAREILAKKAKIQDARSKINRIRDGRPTSPRRNSNIKVIGTNILRKTDPNGKISLITNKSSHKSDINLAIQKQLGLIPSPRSNTRRTTPKRSLNMNSAKPAVSIRKTILNDVDYYEPDPEPLRVYDPALYKWTKPAMRPHPASRMINALDTRQVVREAIREELHEWPTYATHALV